MGHYCKYEINADENTKNKEVFDRLINKLEEDNWDSIDGNFGDGGYWMFIGFCGSHSYSFSIEQYIKEFLEEIGLKAELNISVWYEEREPDESININTKDVV